VTVSLPPDTFARFRESVKLPQPKSAERQQIADQVAEFLAKGGTIQQIPAGKQTDAEQSFNKQDLINHHKRRTRAVYELRRRGVKDD
jgi:hypothetical protein